MLSCVILTQKREANRQRAARGRGTVWKIMRKTGYLREPFRLFHLKDSYGGEMQLHYHDFYKIIVFYGAM